MSSVNESAIANFLKAGGRVSHVKESARVTESELLDYLASSGVEARYMGGDYRAYLCGGKRVSASELISIANAHRHSLQLAPFALRIAILGAR